MGMFPQERRSTWKNTEHEMETGFVWGLIGIRGLVVGLKVYLHGLEDFENTVYP